MRQTPASRLPIEEWHTPDNAAGTAVSGAQTGNNLAAVLSRRMRTGSSPAPALV